uniref:methyl-accepting chemotaxis protein n=1 Tax=Gordoniibacillus kamchatkensis TaxID=1590651 RepID=UPI0018CD13DD|nr:methyl-accepting chemotaxis protein [Paenibacillus sp. VKM B-2647]
MLISVFLLFRKIRPLHLVVHKLQELSGNKGDLTARLPDFGQDEIGQLARSFNTMLDNYQVFIRNIFQSAHQLAAASHQISASIEEISGSSQSQAQASQTINELFRELSHGVDSVAKNAESAADLSEQTARRASEGNTIIAKSLDGMNRLNQQVSVLVEHSGKIGQIIEVIDEIADQTNLLALNAAIEAARAGEQGRGFAVVADEVRKLAERSSDATKEITHIIKAMQVNMEQSAQAAKETAENSTLSGEAFKAILDMVNGVALKVSEIAAATEQQAAQSSEILNSVETIAAGSEESAAASQESAASAMTLASLAEQLNQSVAAFKI